MPVGKHDIGEPINEALENHYKLQLELKDQQLEEARQVLEDARTNIEKLKFEIDMHKSHIEELEKALVKMTVEAATARG